MDELHVPFTLKAPRMSWSYRFIVDHVHDGDSVEGVLDLGLGIYLGQAPTPLYGIRLAGLNAPELGKPGGTEARDYLETIVQPGDILDVLSIRWDKYARRIDAIALKDGLPDSVNDMMLSSGHAVPYP